mgnify:CR=1 FL=1
MNIAIIGYGKMGREIEKIARSRNHQIGLVIDQENMDDLHADNLQEIDVAIEFSAPEAAFENITKCLDHRTPVVSGTTGWMEKWEAVVKLAEKNNTGFFYASNFSIGVNIMFAVNTYLAGIMEQFHEYGVSMEEVHHVHKLDAPSGTAISLAEQIDAKQSGLNGWTLDKNDNEKIFINAKREGEVNGYHHVRYDSDFDTITLSHNAKSRKGFATGAVMAAEYIQGKTGIHSMQQLLNL